MQNSDTYSIFGVDMDWIRNYTLTILHWLDFSVRYTKPVVRFKKYIHSKPNLLLVG
jgi:hypothetical protein